VRTVRNMRNSENVRFMPVSVINAGYGHSLLVYRPVWDRKSRNNTGITGNNGE